MFSIYKSKESSVRAVLCLIRGKYYEERNAFRLSIFARKKQYVSGVYVAVGKSAGLSVVHTHGKYGGEYCRNFSFHQRGFASADVYFEQYGDSYEFLHFFFCADYRLSYFSHR